METYGLIRDFGVLLEFTRSRGRDVDVCVATQYVYAGMLM